MFDSSNNRSTARLQGTDIYLQLLQPSHAVALHDYKASNRCFHAPFSPLQVDSQFSLDAQHDAIELARNEAAADQAYRFGIFHQTSDQLIGQINLTGIIRGVFHNALLGYSMDERFQGYGYMTEAVKLCMDAAFLHLQLHRVQAAVMPHNKGSVRVLQKNKFTEEGYARKYLKINGVWEDHLLFALISDDWQAPL